MPKSKPKDTHSYNTQHLCSKRHPTGTTASFAFGGHPLGLAAPVAGAKADEVPTLGFSGGRPRGFSLPEEAFFDGETRANGSLGLSGWHLGLGGARTVPGGRGTSGSGGRPRPFRGGALGSGFMQWFLTITRSSFCFILLRWCASRVE